MEEIGATYLAEQHRWDDTVIVQCRAEDKKLIKVKTKADTGELVAGLNYNFCGRWSNHFRWGRQFVAQSFVKIQPHDEAGIVAYLTRAPHVGRKTAQELWRKYNSEAVKMLREDPCGVVETLELRGFTKARAGLAAAFLEEEKQLEDATIDLMNVLAGKGFPRDTLKKSLRKWNNRAAEIVRRNPYLLMQFSGCGFGKTDALYLERGGNPARLKRQALCVWHGVSRDTTGSTWFDRKFIISALAEKIGSATPQPVKAVKLGQRGRLLSVYRDESNEPWFTESGRSQAENDIAEIAAHLLASSPAWPDVADLDISSHQAEQLAHGLMAPLGVFAGSAGTGKTYAAARLISRIIKEHGSHEVAIVAPTGKAAVRITEALTEYGINIRAKTIHSYLGVMAMGEEYGGGWAFSHGEGEPVDERFVVVDESSMVDTALMASLLRALRPDGHILFVGDIEQLPPVGHGAPLRDLIAAGAPTGELKEIRRNAGLIVETCTKIRDKEPFSPPLTISPPERNLMIKPAASQDEAAETIIRLVQTIRDRGLQDPVWETQVIVAVNEKSPLSRRELNRLLQAELNGRNRGRSRFWPNDKIICLKNQFLLPVENVMDDIDPEEDWEGFMRKDDSGRCLIYVANGELGRVIEEFPNKLILEFSSPKRVVLIPKGEGGKIDFDLGYAISCHKSQGSEWPLVIIAIDDYYGAQLVCDRSWVYTAISRARRACILVGKESTVKTMCVRQKIHNRKTFLVERLHAARARLLGGTKDGGIVDAPYGAEKKTEENLPEADTSPIHGAC